MVTKVVTSTFPLEKHQSEKCYQIIRKRSSNTGRCKHLDKDQLGHAEILKGTNIPELTSVCLECRNHIHHKSSDVTAGEGRSHEAWPQRRGVESRALAPTLK